MPICPRLLPHRSWLLAALLALPGLVSAVTLTPTSSKLLLEVTFLHPETQAETTAVMNGVLEGWPHRREGSDKDGSWEVFSLLPSELREVEFVREPGDGVRWRRGTAVYRFLFHAFAILPTTSGLEQQLVTPVGREREITDEVMELEEEDEKKAEAALASVNTSPVSLETDLKFPQNALPLERVLRIKSLYPPGWDGKVKGRYLRYHQNWKGTGKVQPVRATFFGGSGDDEFVDSAALADGSILAIGHIADAAFLEGQPVTMIGSDPAPDAEPTITVGEGKKQKSITLQQRAPVLVRYDRDLTKILQVIRLPFRTATIGELLIEDGQTAYLSLRTRPNAEKLLQSLKVVTTVEPGQDADRRLGTAVLKLRLGEQIAVEWVVDFPGAGINIGPRKGPEILAWAGTSFRVIHPDGTVGDGPVLTPGFGGSVVASPVDDALFLSATRNSGTGREPWKCPRFRHYAGDGTVVMALYDWSGPVVGLDVSRQVSDSLGMKVWPDRAGDIFLNGKSDGGNTCYANIPYDITKHHNKYGAINDMSAASVGLYSSFLRISAKTHDVTSATWLIGYHPILDYPSAGVADDVTELDNGLVAIAAGFSYGMIETQDSWYPTYLNRKANPDLTIGNPRGGPALCVLTPDLKKMVFASIVPSVKPMRVASQGNRIVISGSSPEHAAAYEDEVEPIIKEPVQAAYGGGGTDAYLMLVDTEGAL